MRLLIVALVLSFVACGEEASEEPIHPPLITAVEGKCAKKGDRYFLDEVVVTVRDEDGVVGLDVPLLVVDATRLYPEATEHAPPEPEEEPIDITYRWVRPDDGDPQIYCGESGDSLVIDFVVKDADGFPTQPVYIPTKPVEA